MAFKLLYDLSGAQPNITVKSVTDSEAITAGEALVMASGKLTKATAGAAVAYIAANGVEAGTDNTCSVITVTPTQVYENDYTGTADSGFVVGVTTADIDDTGLLINAADITGGPCTVHSINTTAKTCQVVFNNSYTSFK